MDNFSILLYIEGSVQGVGFRYATQQKARQLALNGYVRNCDEGGVEILVTGSMAQIEALQQWLNRGGPLFARIRKITTTAVPAHPEMIGFIIK